MGEQAGTGRIEAFSDGVIAIIITIMGLDLKLPDQATELGLWRGILAPILPKLLAYLLSFALVGIMWVNHHQLVRTVKSATRALIW